MSTWARSVSPPASRTVDLPAVLGDGPHHGPLPQYRPGTGGRGAQRIIEFLAGHHGQQRFGVAPGELPAAVQGGGDRVHGVPGRDLDVAAGHRQRRADQAAPAGLVTRVLGPLQHHGARPGGRRGQRGGQARRSPAGHRDIPRLVFRHPRSVDEPAPGQPHAPTTAGTAPWGAEKRCAGRPRRPAMGRMTWTAPQVTRTDPPTVAGERESLETWLDYHRDTLLFKCQGLTGEQLARRAVAPSSLSLLGLVRHMTEVERAWFRIRFAGRAGAGPPVLHRRVPRRRLRPRRAGPRRGRLRRLPGRMPARPGGGGRAGAGRDVRAFPHRDHHSTCAGSTCT